MYDKISLFFSIDEVRNNIFDLKTIVDEEGKEITDNKEGKTSYEFHIENMKIIMTFGGLLIRGSLPKFYYGNNIHTLDRKTTKEALEKLSDCLHTDTTKAKVTSLEFGNTFLMKYKPTNYFNLLGNLARFVRDFSPRYKGETLYYFSRGQKTQSKVITFYDKAAEMKASKTPIPIEFENCNLLRYELRLNNRIKNQLKMPEVTGKSLTEYETTKRLLQMYKEYYNNIIKITQTINNEMKQMTVKDAKNYLFAKYLKQAGQREINEDVQQLKCRLKDKRDYSRLKADINNCLTKLNNSNDELLNELNDVISNTGQKM